MIRTTSLEAKTKLDDLIEAALRGEDVLITARNERGERTVRIVAIPDKEPRRKAGSLKGKIWMSDDFDEPLDDFKDYQ
jgi:antitoxin (DNA-binding transcriptional repressor) of toxin-antitoxin stability system